MKKLIVPSAPFRRGSAYILTNTNNEDRHPYANGESFAMQEFYWLPTIVAGLGSGLVVATLHHGVALYREHLDFRRGRLEALHQAIFTLTFELETILSPLSAEVALWLALEKERQAGKYVGDKLDVIHSRVQLLAEEILRDRTELLRELETAVRLISIHFPNLAGARQELTSLVQQTLALARNPRPVAADAQNKFSALSTQAGRIGEQLIGQVWSLHQPDSKWTWFLSKRQGTPPDNAGQLS